MEECQGYLEVGYTLGGVDTLSQAGSWVACCSWQAGRPGRYSFAEGRLLVDIVELPEVDGVAAALPETQESGQDQRQEPGRWVEGSSETAAAAAAVEGQAEGLQAESCILLKTQSGPVNSV